MFKRIFVLILMVGLSSCNYLEDNVYHFKWAEVDSRKLETAIKEIIKEQNPYPQSYALNKTDLQSSTRTLSRQISQLKTEAREKCRLEAKADDKKAPIVNRPDIIVQREKILRGGYDQRCLSRIDDDQLIKDLQKQLDDINQITNLQRQHDRAITVASQKEMDNIISDFATDKFDLVIDKNSKVPYNKTGLALDITDALLRHIEATSIAVDIADQQS
jgi:hypothetical protein